MLGIQSKINTYMHNTILKPANSISFCGEYYGADSFERNSEYKKKITLFNPYTMKMCTDTVRMDLKKEQDIMLESGKNNHITFHYDPNMTDYVTDKKTGLKKKAVILKTENPDNENQFSYHIMSDDLSEEYGYVCMSKQTDKKKTNTFGENKIKRYLKKIIPNTEPIHRQDLTKDYKDRVEGDRIEIEYCQNTSGNKVTGIGKLGDILAVRYCLENQIEPSVVFYSMNNSHIENYKRGNRFLPLEKNSDTAKMFMKKYGTDNPNRVMENLMGKGIASPRNTKNWGDLGMYMPKTIIESISPNYTYVEMKLENPFKSGEYYTSNLYMDFDKPREIILTNGNNLELNVKYDPEMKGHLIDKKTGKPVETYILRVTDEDEPDEDAFVFMSTNLDKRYGYVELDKGYEEYDEDLYYDYKTQGLVGDRIVVAYLRNDMQAKIGGVGQLADRVAVKYCLENGIDPPCIISHAAEGSHVAHYLRGKRFVPPFKSDLAYSSLKDHYGESNPNKILKRLIKQSKQDGEPVDIKGWGELSLVMYLPKGLIDKYAKEGLE